MKRSATLKHIATGENQRAKFAEQADRTRARMDALVAEGKSPQEAASIIAKENMQR